MLLPITLICKKAKARRDGTSVIKIQYCYTSDKRTELDTEIAIPPKYWNRKSHRVADDLPGQYGIAKELNGKLQIMFRIAEDIIGFALKQELEDPLTFVKKTFKPDFDAATLIQQPALAIKQSTTNTDVFFQFDDFIQFKKRKVVEGLITTYGSIKACLKAYETHIKKPLTFQSFDMEFGDNFIDFLTYDYKLRRNKKTLAIGLKQNTIRLYVNLLRCFLNNRMRKGITGPMDLSTLKAPGEEVDAIYLDWQEISQIYNTDLSEYPHLANSRDTLVLGCLTGMRFSDYSSIGPVNIKNGFLHKKQEKTDGWVFVPLRPEAQAILERFKGTVPKVSNNDFNEHVRIIGKLAGLCKEVRFSYKKGNKMIVVTKPKHDWISSHTARRSFCTNEFLAGTPVELIMKISGHKGLMDFYKYIRISPEEAGRKVMQIWQQRGQSLTVEGEAPAPAIAI